MRASAEMIFYADEIEELFEVLEKGYQSNGNIVNLGLICNFDEYSCAMKSHFRKFGNQMSGSGNHLCNYASLLA